MADINNQYHFLDYAGLALFWSNIKKIIEDNELVTAVALTDLDNRVKALFNGESENSIIVAGSGEGSGVMKGAENSATGKNSLAIGQDNEAISENSVAMGSNNIVGLKGWYYKAISFNSSNGEIQLYLSKTQQVPKAVSSASQVEQEKDIDFPLTVGTIVSVVNDVKYDNKFKIERIDELSIYGRIKLSRADGNKTLYFSDVKVETELSPEDYSIYCLSRPAEGIVDLGQSSFVTGDNNKAINGKTVSFGINNTSWGKCGFTEGMSNEAGYAAHAEGKGNKAIGNHSHAEGQNNEAWKTSSHAEGATNITYGPASHIEGKNNYIGEEDTTVVVADTSTKGYAAHVEGQANVVLGNSGHAEGIKNKVYDNGGHAEGRYNVVNGIYGHTEGEFNESIGARAHSEGCYTKAEGADSHAENEGSIARGINSHAEGYYTLASGITSHAEGASRANDPEYNPDEPAFAVVEKYLEARGQRSHAEGYATQAFGNQSHAEGIDTLAEGTNSHSEGQETQALSNNSHSEGNKTIAKGADTHAEGYHTITNAWASHAEGIETYTTNQGEHAQGKYNLSTMGPSASEATIHSIGIGKSGKRQNAQEVKADGTHYIYGIGGYDGTNYDDAEDVASAIKNLVEITYAGLVNLRSNSVLTPGRLYRITDYITTTTQADTQSAGNAFDIIVLALSESVLSEQAWAIQSARDTDGYFANSKLSAWKIWYSLDNDTTRFAWADATNGKGVIYRMIDEWNNDCPYDFKNIQFVRYELNAPDEYISGTSVDGWIEVFTKNVRMMFDADKKSYIWSGLNDDGKYWEKDFNAIYSSPTGVSKAFYTFSSYIDEDASMSRRCHNNKMMSSSTLPNNVFFGNNCYNNSFGNECICNSFNDYFYNNSFGNNCYNNSFGNNCFYNTFDNNNYYNSFGDNFFYNSFGIYCNNNSFGNNCNYNSFGNSCTNNSFSNRCDFNTFNNACVFNSFGDNCTSNSFGNECVYNSFGNECVYNNFANWCVFNSFRISGDNTSSLISYCRYNAFDDGCSYNIVYSANTNSSTYLENYHINRGVKGTDTNPMLIDAQYLNSENVCNVYRKGDVAVVAYIQY